MMMMMMMMMKKRREFSNLVLLMYGMILVLFSFGGVEGNGSSLIGNEVLVMVDGKVAVAKTDGEFICATVDWWPPEKCDYGTCSWGSASLLNLNLSSKILVNAVKEFSPLKLRLGGTLQDKVIYNIGNTGEPCTSFVKNSSEMFSFTQGCLPQSRWDELNHFFRKTGAIVVFGLNALYGRVPLQDGSVKGPWNSTNAAALIHYTVKNGYKIHGWELGNELSGSGIGARISADQYAADVITLKSIINEIYKNSTVKKPLVIAPGGFFDADWFGKLINHTKANSLDVVSHHIYNLGPGVDAHLIDKILDPKYLDGEASVFSNLQRIIRSSGSLAKAWVGEAGGAYNSGRNICFGFNTIGIWISWEWHQNMTPRLTADKA